MPVLWRRDAAGELEDAGPSALKIVLEDGSLALPKFGEPLRPQMPTRPVPQGGGLAPPTGGGGLAPPPTVAGGLAPPPPPPTVPLAAGSLAIPRPVGVGGGLAAPPPLRPRLGLPHHSDVVAEREPHAEVARQAH